MTSTTVPPNVVHNVNATDMEIAFSGPAPHCNRYILTVQAGIARLSFLEQSPSGVSEYRTAVSIPQSDLVILVQLIQQVGRPLGIPVP